MSVLVGIMLYCGCYGFLQALWLFCHTGRDIFGNVGFQCTVKFSKVYYDMLGRDNETVDQGGEDLFMLWISIHDTGSYVYQEFMSLIWPPLTHFLILMPLSVTILLTCVDLEDGG